MKKLLLIATLCFIAIGSALCQAVPYNVVFDITGNEPAIQQRMITLIKEIVDSRADAKVEVVFYGGSIAIVDKTKSGVMDDITKLARDSHVQFRACAIAMKKHNLDESGLVNGVQSVPDGIYEIVKKQAAGYAYIKIVQ